MGTWRGSMTDGQHRFDVEVHYETPGETHQGVRWHGVITGGVLAVAGLRRRLKDAETSRSIDTDIGVIQIESTRDRISFTGASGPRGSLAAAIGSS